ncbi:hypothetical protein J6590_106238 [Homalodisca vitripennis]|nr:hypothetical protein J6590_106238 [Homalodisca vitripennis]
MAVYRPPDGDSELSFDRLEDAFRILITSKSRVIRIRGVCLTVRRPRTIHLVHFENDLVISACCLLSVGRSTQVYGYIPAAPIFPSFSLQ